jgi:2'-5' RNA ligase
MSTIRTFIAVESSGSVASRAASVIERLRAAQGKVTWVKPENMHWTLRFLGDVDLNRTADICQAVSEAVAAVEPFELEVLGVGAFPHTRRPRAIWLGAGEGKPQMAELASTIETQLSHVGFRPEKRVFTPHLTIGRVRGSQNIEALGELIDSKADFSAGTVFVDEVVVFSSYLERGEVTYQALGRANLG